MVVERYLVKNIVNYTFGEINMEIVKIFLCSTGHRRNNENRRNGNILENKLKIM